MSLCKIDVIIKAKWNWLTSLLFVWSRYGTSYARRKTIQEYDHEVIELVAANDVW